MAKNKKNEEPQPRKKAAPKRSPKLDEKDKLTLKLIETTADRVRKNIDARVLPELRLKPTSYAVSCSGSNGASCRFVVEMPEKKPPLFVPREIVAYSSSDCCG